MMNWQTAFDWMVSLSWGSILDHAKSLALPLAGVYVAHKFGSIQAEIGRRQAQTAAQSMKVASNKLRLDLFEQRFPVYETAYRLINKAIRETGSLTLDDVHQFYDGTLRADWLFDERVARYLTDTVFHDAFELATLLQKLADPDPVEQQKLVVKKFALATKFTVHMGMLHTLMAPYLGFTDRFD